MRRLSSIAVRQNPPVQLDIRFFVHATEDPDKVLEAVKHLLPPDYVDGVVFEKASLKGHYGNTITFLETRIKKREIVKATVKILSTGLNKGNKETLLREIDLHVEKGSLYVRLNKQAAFQGEFKLCSADPIRLRIRFKKGQLEDIIKACRELGILL